MELYKYIKQEYHPSNALEIRMSFFSPAFLPCLSEHWFDPQDKDKILQDVSQASVAAAFPKPPTSMTLSQDPQETAGMEDITAPSHTKSVTWMPSEDSPPPPNEPLQPHHPGFQNFHPRHGSLLRFDLRIHTMLSTMRIMLVMIPLPMTV
jgi:hypothetical protein